MAETAYQALIRSCLRNEISIDSFVERFSEIWRSDRDSGEMTVYCIQFQRLIDRVFTNCDCLAPTPESATDMDEDAFRTELQLMYEIWWGYER